MGSNAADGFARANMIKVSATAVTTGIERARGFMPPAYHGGGRCCPHLPSECAFFAPRAHRITGRPAPWMGAASKT